MKMTLDEFRNKFNDMTVNLSDLSELIFMDLDDESLLNAARKYLNAEHEFRRTLDEVGIY